MLILPNSTNFRKAFSLENLGKLIEQAYEYAYDNAADELQTLGKCPWFSCTPEIFDKNSLLYIDPTLIIKKLPMKLLPQLANCLWEAQMMDSDDSDGDCDLMEKICKLTSRYW